MLAALRVLLPVLCAAVARAQDALPEGDNSTVPEAPADNSTAGGEDPAGDEYDLALAIAGVFIILAASALGIFGTIIIGSNKRWKTNSALLLVFQLLKFFGIGVIISTAWIHLITDSVEQFSSDNLPEGWKAFGPAYTGLFAMIAGFFFHGVEFYAINLHVRKGEHVGHAHGHSHGASFGGSGDEEANPSAGSKRHGEGKRKRSKKTVALSDADLKLETAATGGKEESVPLQEMSMVKSAGGASVESVPAVADEDAGATQLSESSSSGEDGASRVVEQAVLAHREDEERRREEIYDEVVGRHGHNDHEHGIVDDPALAEEINADVALKVGTIMLEAGIIFHSIIIGLTLGVVQATEWRSLVVAIAFHQFFEGMALGVRIAELKYSTVFKTLVLGLLYPLTTPVAIAVGIGIRQTLDQESPEAVVVQGIFDALSAGILMYTGYVEFLASEVNYSKTFNKHNRWRKLACFFFMWLGAAAMAIVGIWA